MQIKVRFKILTVSILGVALLSCGGSTTTYTAAPVTAATSVLSFESNRPLDLLGPTWVMPLITN